LNRNNTKTTEKKAKKVQLMLKIIPLPKNGQKIEKQRK
jgi:hypothetical protein